jgi:hypothetical protein
MEADSALEAHTLAASAKDQQPRKIEEAQPRVLVIGKKGINQTEAVRLSE